MVDTKKEELGKNMVHRCAGLPLAIIVLGGILATKSSTHEWQMVFENFKSYLKKGKGLSTEDVLALSYDDLPPYLRPSFLYLGVFPEDYEIGAERLIQLWVAEGTVSTDGGEMMEDVAEHCLVELVERYMLQVGKRGPTLKIKTCHMHDLMRDLCLPMAKKENFLCILEDPSISPPARRIVAHQPISFVNIRSCPLRSILFFADPFDEDDALHKENIANPNMQEFLDKNENKGACIPILLILWVYRFYKWHGCWRYLFNNFKSLRVLTFEGSSVDAGFKLPKAIGNLTHLRFLSLKGFEFLCSRIPSTLGNLRCLQTLDLRIGRYEGDFDVYVPNVIWKLEELRHLYLPEKMNSKSKLKLHTLKNLLTLVNFNTNNCFIADLSKLLNLRKLKMHVYKNVLEDNLPIITSKNLQSLSIHYHEDEGGIDPKLSANLLSSCVNLGELTFAGEMEKLPEHHHFSSSISCICFKGCSLKEDPMPTLGKLPNLRILEFKRVRINGKEMVCSAPCFPNP